MSEIEKMYKLADVQPQYKKRIECKEGHRVGQPCEKCPCIDCDKSVFEDVMPPFTAEKQINLILFLANREIRISPTYISSGYYLNNLHKIKSSRNISTFENSLAQHINALWQDLTEEERKQIKEILE